MRTMQRNRTWNDDEKKAVIVDLDKDIQSLTKVSEDLSAKNKSLEENIKAQEAIFDRASKGLQKVKADQSAMQLEGIATMTKRGKEIEDMKATLKDREAEVAKKEREIEKKEDAIEKLESKNANAAESNRTARGKADVLEERLEQSKAHADELQLKLDSREAKVKEAEKGLRHREKAVEQEIAYIRSTKSEVDEANKTLDARKKKIELSGIKMEENIGKLNAEKQTALDYISQTQRIEAGLMQKERALRLRENDIEDKEKELKLQSLALRVKSKDIMSKEKMVNLTERLMDTIK